MKIEVVQLENIRSHVKSTVPFSKGFNCLVGGLGCGKSSVLLGIDFAFFGEPLGRSYEYLLREGADWGRVSVQFSVSGNSYLLVRGLRRRGKNIGQDFEMLKLFHDDKLVASMKADAVAEQLRAITGFDRDLWREIVWVRQEYLKELLDVAPRDRQKRLDGLFGLSDYEVAWGNLALFLRDYETEKRVLEKDVDVVGREKFGDEYNRVTEEFTFLEIELQDVREKLAVVKRLLAEAEANLGRVEEKRLAVEELKRKETKLNADIVNLGNVRVSLEKRLEGKRMVLGNLGQRRVSLEGQIKSLRCKLGGVGVLEAETFDHLRLLLLSFDDRISGLRGELEALSRSLQLDQKRLVELSSESGSSCPLCLQPLSGEYRVGMLERIRAENAGHQVEIRRLLGEIEEIKKKKVVVSEVLSELENLVLRAGDLEVRVGEEEAGLVELEQEISDKQAVCVGLLGELEVVRFEIGQFDVSGVNAARLRREEVFREFCVLESELRVKEGRRRDLFVRLDELKERIDLAQRKVERLERIGQIVGVVGAVRDAYRGIQPKLRCEFVRVLRNFVQQVLDGLVGGEAEFLNVVVDDSYTPFVVSEGGVVREVGSLSGGERTLLAFAFRLGLGQLIMQFRCGHGLGLLLLDEPTENLGSEDGSISRLGEAVGRFKAIEQIIAVTHSEDFAEKASNIIVLEKEGGVSRVSIVKDE